MPNTDTALMLGLAHTLAAEGLHDRAFLDRFCVGYATFEDYLLGRTDGQPKDAAWAAAICGIPPDEIVALARALAGRRTLIAVAHALQRAEHGEQPVWMAAVLAAMLGPDRPAGRRLRLRARHASRTTGGARSRCRCPTLPQGRNRVRGLHPGGAHRRHAAAARATRSTTTASA